MNQLESLKTHSTVVADTGDFLLMARYRPQDATTNPSLVLKAAKSPNYAAVLAQALRSTENTAALEAVVVAFGCEILKLIPGRVSSEVDARLSFDTQGTIAQAERLVARYAQAGVARERVLIKIAATWEGIAAARVLERAGIHCNLTLLFSFAQARACADAGVTLISPFVGRILDWYKKNDPEALAAGDPGVASVQRIYSFYKQHGYATEVMGASFRSTAQVLALAGCDLLTISPDWLDALQAAEGSVTRALVPPSAQSPAPPPLAESAFRWQLNEDAMASEKLAEGIRLFARDTVALETLIAQQGKA